MSKGGEIIWKDLTAGELPRLPSNVVTRGGMFARDSLFVAGQTVREELETYFGEERHLERLALLFGKVWQKQSGSSFVAHVSSYECITGSHTLPAESSPVHVRMSSLDWQRVWAVMGERQVIGWAHSHLGCGVRPSATDLATQRCWFPQPWALALIFDPCAGTRAAYAGRKCEPVMLEEVPELTALLL